MAHFFKKNIVLLTCCLTTLDSDALIMLNQNQI